MSRTRRLCLAFSMLAAGFVLLAAVLIAPPAARAQAPSGISDEKMATERASALPEPADSGGPDEAGYVYLDSSEPGGPIYFFESITETGFLLSLSDDQVSAALPMSFTFEFYGTTYSDVYVSSNGFLTFLPGSDDGCCTGRPIPETGTPDGLIAGWWEDLNPSNGGTIHYETLGVAPDRRFIVQFTDIQHFGGGNPVSMQFKLFEGSNQIEVHYQEAPSDGGPHAAGIENQDGTVGLQYTRTSASLITPLAVRYLPDTTLGLRKTVSAPVAMIGETVTFTVRVRNGNEVTDTNVIVTDTLPAGLALAGTSVSQGPGCLGDPIVVCPLGDLAAGAVATVTLQVTATAEGTHVNMAEVTGTLPDPLPQTNEDSAAVYVLPDRFPPLYGSAYSGRAGPATLYRIDPLSGEATLIGPIGFNRVGALDFHPETGVLYGVGERANTTDTVGVLITIDPLTGLGTEIGPTGLPNTQDISFRNGDSTLYGHYRDQGCGKCDVLGGNNYVVTFTLDSGTATVLGPTDTCCSGNGIAFSSGDLLYHADDGEVNTLDQMSGTATFVASLDFPPPLRFARVNGMDAVPGGSVHAVSINDGGKGTSGADGPRGLNPGYVGLLLPETGLVAVVTPTVEGLDALAFAPVPEIQIEKSPDLQTVVSGSAVTFTIQVTNSGSVPLNDVTVSDPLAPACSAGLGTLAPGAGSTYDCLLAGVTADLTNTATVTGSVAAGGQVSATDEAMVDVINPAITIEKSPDFQQLVSGETVTFTIAVTNTGDITLTQVTVDDPLFPVCSAALADLPAGTGTSYTCETSNWTVDFTNTATVTAVAPVGDPVTDSDTAVVDVIGPAIAIEKSPDLQQITMGGQADFTIQVTNTGDITLTNVIVGDPLAPACDAALGDLAAGASTSYGCALAGITDDLTNTATVTGTAPTGADVSASDSALVDVIAPAISIEKSPDLQLARNGDTVTFTIAITNSGDVELTNVTVTDPLAPGCAAALGTLAAGASTSYDCTQSNVASDFNNVATVTGDYDVGPQGSGPTQVSASDDAFVDVINPAISIVKSPNLQQVVPGGTANFTIQVFNLGDSPLSGVTVSDPLVPGCDAALGDLAVGANTSYNCADPGVTASYTNTAIATGTPLVGPDVSDSDTGMVEVVVPTAITLGTAGSGPAPLDRWLWAALAAIGAALALARRGRPSGRRKAG